MGLLASALLVVAALLPPGEPPQPPCPQAEEITPAAASSCVGEQRRVVARIDHVSRSKAGLTFVNFCADWRSCPFTAVVFPDHVAVFAMLPRLSGSEVSVSGKITAFQGRPQIVLQTPDQLVVRTLPPRAPVPVRVAAASSGDAVAVVEAPPPRLPPVVVVKQVAPAAEADPVEVPRAGVGEAAAFVGRRARLRGEVQRLDFRDGELVVFFRRGAAEVPFVAVIAEPDVDRLKDAAAAWDGHAVEVEGEVGLYNGRPGMFVHEATQVRAPAPRAGR